MKNDKKEILIEVRNFIYSYWFEGDINKISSELKLLPKKMRETYPLNMDYKNAHRFSIRKDTEYDYGSNDSHDVYILQCYRWETDEELEARLEFNKKQNKLATERKKKLEEAKEKREKTIYEALKKKFEKKN